jgi:hypothetical protein
MTPLELYVWTLRNLGVPDRTTFEDGQFVYHGPFTKLAPEALRRVLDCTKGPLETP